MRASSSRLLLAAALLGALATTTPTGDAAFRRGPALSATLEAKTVLVKEGGLLKVRMTIVNTGDTTLAGVHPLGTELDVSGSGWLDVVKLPKALAVVLAPGKSASFDFAYRAGLCGSVTLRGVAKAGPVQSAPTAPLVAQIVPKKIGDIGITSATGDVWLKVGKAPLPMRFVDRRTGSPIGGLAVAITVNPKNKGEALGIAVDGLGRYPDRLFTLRGAPAHAAPAAKVAGSPPPPPPAPIVAPVPETILGYLVDTYTTGLLPPAIETAKSAESPHWDLLPATLQKIQKSKLVAEVFKQHKVLNGVLHGVLPSVEETTVPLSELPIFLQGKASELASQGITDGAVLVLVAVAFPHFAASAAFQAILANVALGYTKSLGQLTAAGALGALFDLLGIENVRIVEIRWGGKTYLMVLPGPDSPPKTIQELVAGLVHAAAADPQGQPISGGCLRMLSKNPEGIVIESVLDSGGNADIPVPIGSYDVELCAPGYQPVQTSVQVTPGGVTVQAMLPVHVVKSGTLTTAAATTALPEGSELQVQPSFFNTIGQPVPCSGIVTYSVENPLSGPVASVDANGRVTMLGGCGAAAVTAWCNGVTTSPLKVSSDCSGKLPAVSKKAFVVSPPSLAFSVEEGASPPSQSLILINLKPSTLFYTWQWFTPWHVASPTSGGAHSVSIDSSGFAPGSYSSSIEFFETGAPKNRQVIPVKLVVKAKPPASFVGVWKGTWSRPVAGFCDETSTLTWDLKQSGKSVTGTYTKVVKTTNGLCPDPVGTVLSGTLVQGVVQGNKLTIFTSGGTQFSGTLSGSTITGVGGTSLGFGPFSLTKQ